MKPSDKQNWKLDLATVKDLAGFFRIDRTAVPGVMTTMGVPRRGAGYPWIRIWIALGIDLSSTEDHETLSAPLLELKEVAPILGESPKNTRRRSDGKHRDKSIPAHIDLGPRKRLFFPAEIETWLSGEPVPFERKQEKLSFIPARKDENKASKKTCKKPKAPQASSPSAVASMFMAPPNPN